MALAMSKAAPLKPDIKLSQALKDYEAILTDDQQKVFHSASPLQSKDVMALTYEIDRQNASRKSRRWGPRLTTFLNSVKGFTVVVDSIVGNTANPIAGLVWGAVKMAMLAASGFESYFDALSTMLMNVGQSAPRYEKYAVLYPTSASLRQELCNYFSIVITFCKSAVLFVRKPFISQALHALRKPFNDEFGKLQNDLIKNADAVRDELSLAAKQQQNIDSIEGARERKENSLFRRMGATFQKEAVRDLEEKRKWRELRSRSRVLSSCSTYNHETSLNQARRKGASRWILETNEYKEWKSSDSSSIFLCSGIIGSGKTVLASSVIEELVITRASNSLVGYFFCKYDDCMTLEAREIIGSLARQFLSGLPAYLFNKVGRDIDGITLNIEQIISLAQRLLPTSNQYIIVLDGLDECESKEAFRVSEALQILLGSSTHSFKLFWTGRSDFIAKVSHQLRSDFHLTITKSKNGSDISDFIELALDEALGNGRLQLRDPSVIIQIQNALQRGAHEMFLWVTFQIDSICQENTDEGILKALTNLPRDLPTTYRRILRRLRDSGSTDRRVGKKMFEIVSAARRPLNLEEIREAISIEPGNIEWSPTLLVNDVMKSLDCCASLLVVDEELSTVCFAHSSVKQHLETSPNESDVDEYHINSISARTLLSEIVITYLNLEAFQKILTKESSTLQTLTVPDMTALLTASLQPNRIVSSLARTLLRNRKTPGFDVSRELDRVASSTRISKLHPLEIGSFLPYAQEHWLFHTESFEFFEGPSRSKCYNVWIQLIEGNVPTINLPWTSEDALSLNKSFLELVAKSDSLALTSYTLRRLQLEQKNDHVYKCRLFLRFRPSSSRHDSWYNMLLEAAVKSRDSDLVNLLLRETSADVNKPVEGSGCLLNEALEQKDLDIFEILINHGANVNTRGGRYGTVMGTAAVCSTGKYAISMLLERGATAGLFEKPYNDIINDIIKEMREEDRRSAIRVNTHVVVEPLMD